MRPPSVGSVVTLLAVACAAYLVADVAHEGLGHGGACLALGGKSIVLSTTYEDCSIRSRLIDGAGPVAGITVALLAWASLCLAQPAAIAARTFLCLTFAFAAFWNVGYMVKSGLMDEGDWAFVIKGLEPTLLWHAGLTILGVVLYSLSIRMLASSVRRALPSGEIGQRPSAFALTAYVAAAALSAVAAYFDPRGPHTILSDALPSSLASVGLIWVGWNMNKRNPELRLAVPLSSAWIATGAASAIFFVVILGPGLRS